LFKIEVKENTVPIFSTKLTNIEVPLMTLYTYKFPNIVDPDYGSQTSILTVEDSATGALPNFITLKKSGVSINATSIS
jgi:hypothetical protein